MSCHESGAGELRYARSKKRRLRSQEASSERNSLDDDDVEHNADLYVSNHEVAHG